MILPGFPMPLLMSGKKLDLVGFSSASLSGSTHTITMPNDIAAGDIILVFHALERARTYSLPSGYTLAGSYDADMPSVKLFYRAAIGTEGGTSFSLSLSGTSSGGYGVLILRGASAPTDYAFHRTASSLAHTTSGLLVGVGLLFAFLYIEGGAGTPTLASSPSDMDAIVTSANLGGAVLVYVKEVVAGTEGGKAFTWTGSSREATSCVVNILPE